MADMTAGYRTRSIPLKRMGTLMRPRGPQRRDSLDWRAKVELFEQIRREYEFGVGTIAGVAKKLKVLDRRETYKPTIIFRFPGH
jgi:hypothetical protein